MKKIKILANGLKGAFVLATFFATFCFSQTSVAPADSSANPADVAFSSVAVSVEVGEVYPWGDLIDAVENSYYAGVGLRYSYWDNVDGVVMFNYSYFTPRPDYVKFYGVHQFSGKLGLDWKWKQLSPIIFGVGFSCSWTRADYDDDVDKKNLYSLPGGTLTDNETEFGWYARINIPLIHYEKFRFGLNVLWDELWTLPERSDMMTAGLYIERSLW